MLVLVTELGFGVLATTGNIYTSNTSETYIENSIDLTSYNIPIYADRKCSHDSAEGNISAETGISISKYFTVKMNGSELTEKEIVSNVSHGMMTVKTNGDIVYDKQTGNLYLTNISSTVGSVSKECSVTLSISDTVKATAVVPTTATVNSWEEIEDVAKNYSATCEKTGYENYTICSVCSRMIKEGNIISPLGHKFDDGQVKVAPTCTTNGTTAYRCTRQGCTYSEEREDIIKLGHHWTSDFVVDKEPSCEEAGSKSYHCTTCGYVDRTTTIDALGHNWNDGEITEPSTCAKEGTKKYTCITCGKTREESVGTIEHTWNDGEITTYSDCTTHGTKTYTCKGCGQQKTEQLDLDTTKHSFTTEVTTNPSCEEVGVKTYTCTRCSYQYTEDIASTGHTTSEVVQDVKRGNDGYAIKDDDIHICYYKTYCTTCGKTLTQTEEEVDHVFEIVSYPEESQKGNWSEWSTITQPTCTTKGKESRSREVYDYPTVKCILCAHTCVSKEKHVYQDETQDREITELGHDFSSEYTIDKQPTCTLTGIKSKHCSRCSQVDDEQVVLALGHTKMAEEIDTSIGVNGYESLDATKHTCHYKTVCSVCEEVVETRTQDFEHTISKTEKMSETKYGDWSEWETITYAKCLETGLQKHSRINTNYPIYECEICKYNYANLEEPNYMTEEATAVIPILNHNMNAEVITSATCTENGLKLWKCSRCDYQYEEVITATGHKDGTEIIDTDKGIKGYASLANEGHTCYYKTPCSVCGITLHERSQNYAHTPQLQGYTTEIKYGDWSDWTITLQPTCSENGSKFHTRKTYNYPMYTCSDCKFEYIGEDKHSLADESETEAITSLGHNFATEFTIDVKAKCTSDGSMSKHCLRCGEKSEVTVIPKTGHSMSEKVIDVQKGTNGYLYYSSEKHTCNYKSLCANCDYIEYTSEELAHVITNTGKMTDNPYSDWSEWEIIENATCTLAGSHKHTRTKTDYPIYACSLCEYQYEDKTAESVETETKTEVIEPLGHEHTKDITKQVTCEEDGLITYTCIRGDDTYTETVTKLGHKWSEGTTTKEPTCTLVGIRTITCSNCQKVKTEEIPALKHQWNEGEVTTLADCITEGVMTYTCLRCNDTKDEKFGIDKDNHNYQSKITIEPKCTVDGEETFTCSRCSNSYTKPVKQLGHDWDSGEITTEPKCEQTGIKTFKCNRCDETKAQTVDALGHDWNSGEVTTIANCTTDGIKTYTCNTCGEKKTENIGKDLTNHDYIREVTVEPTCTKEGEEKFTCSRCGDSYTNVLPMKDHTQGTEIVDTDKGIKGYEDLNNGKHKCYYRTPCSVCDKTLSERNEDFDHTMEVTDYTQEKFTGDWTNFVVKIEPTCTTVGSQTKTRKVWNFAIKTCKFCQNTQTDTEPHYLDDETETEDVKELGHDYQYNVTLKAKCEEKGSQIVTCSRCDYNVTEEIPATGHNWGEGKITFTATCTENGIRTYTCSLCQNTREEKLDIDSTNHDYRPQITKQPACEEEGVTTYTCSRCAKSYTEDIPATGHSKGSEIVDTDKGIKGYEDLNNGKHKCYYHITCTTCGKELEARTQDYDHVTSHTSDSEYEYGNYGDWSQTTAPTCLEAGELTRTRPMWNYPIYTCSFCSYSYTDKNDVQMDTDKETSPVKALGHNFAEEYTIDTPATCLVKGSKSQHCSRCSETQNITEIPLADHKYDAGTETKKPTCETTGVKTFVCSVCTHQKTETIQALGHDFAKDYTVDKEATCLEVGSKSQHCSRCSATQNTTEIPKKDHSWNDGVITLKATCTQKGEMTYTCSVCKTTRTEEYESETKEHSYEEKVTITATCTQKGEKTYTCSLCGDTYTEEIPMKDHTPGTEIIDTDKGIKGYSSLGNSQHTSYYKTLCSVCKTLLSSREATENHTKTKNYTGTYTSYSATQHKKDYKESCSYCNYSTTGSDSPVSHTWNSGSTTTYATCTSTGEKEYTCTASGCGETKTETLAKLTHSYYTSTAGVSAGTHKQGTNALIKCYNCDYSSGGDTIDATHFSYMVYRTYQAAKCEDEGHNASYYCYYCSSYYYIDTGNSAVIDALEHEMIDTTMTDEYTDYNSTTYHKVWWNTKCSRSGCSHTDTDWHLEKHNKDKGDYTGYSTDTDSQHKHNYNYECSLCGRTSGLGSSYDLESHDFGSKSYTGYEKIDSTYHKHNYTQTCSECKKDISGYDKENHSVGSKEPNTRNYSNGGYSNCSSTQHYYYWMKVCTKCNAIMESGTDKENHSMTPTSTSVSSYSTGPYSGMHIENYPAKCSKCGTTGTTSNTVDCSYTGMYCPTCSALLSRKTLNNAYVYTCSTGKHSFTVSQTTGTFYYYQKCACGNVKSKKA